MRHPVECDPSAGDIGDLLEVMAHVVHQRESKHCSIGPGDKERTRSSACGHQAGGRTRVDTGGCGLGALHQIVTQIASLTLECFVMGIAAD